VAGLVAAMGQQAPMRLAFIQEISFSSSSCEAHTISRTTLEDLGSQEKQRCTPCCTVDETEPTVEEIIVVHHEALRKVNYLLKSDDFSGAAELPSIPECVTAAKRAELQRQQQQNTRELKHFRSAARGEDDMGPCGPSWSASAWDDESDSDDPSPTSRAGKGRGPAPSLGPTVRPMACEDDSDVDGLSSMPPPAAPPPYSASGCQSKLVKCSFSVAAVADVDSPNISLS